MFARHALSVTALLFVASTASIKAEDLLLETNVELKTPKKNSKRAAEGGLKHASFRMWVPDNVATIRGVVFNPFYTKAVTQGHWQAACRHWKFGILAANLFGAKNTEFPDLIDAALADFAKQTGHAEIANAILCPVGMSAGAGMCVKITELMPERIIAVGAVCLEVGPRNTPSMGVPIMTIFGEKDGKQYEKLMAKLPQVRGQHARFSIAVQWRRRHEFARANNLLVPFFDAVIRQRLGEPNEPLREFKESSGWLGDVSQWGSGEAVVTPFSDFDGDQSQACWFPDEQTARTWQAFVTKEPALQIKQPPGLGDGQPFIIHRTGEEIVIQGRKKGNNDDNETIEVYAGARKIAALKDGTATVQFETPGFYPVFLKRTLSDGTVQLSRPNTLVVSNGGNET